MTNFCQIFLSDAYEVIQITFVSQDNNGAILLLVFTNLLKPTEHTFESVSVGHVKYQNYCVQLIEIVLRNLTLVLLTSGIPHNHINWLI